ncbi:MAG: DNA internalization-related competence protein ComEC/Rec2 [Lachnospiraceae bacterium]|nr:DNA internalization-related competence protein ComEC/Rec2 [Lachnospiraceae bacterium]
MYLRRPLCAFCLLFALSLAIIMQCTGETGGTPEQTGYKGKRTGFTGVIRRMENKNGRLILQISNTSISDRDILLYLSEENLTEVKLHTGQKISASGIPGEFDHAHNRGEFDLKDHYDLKGIDFPVYEGVITGTGTSYDHLKDGLYRIRNNTAAVYEKYFEPEEYGVIKALVLADRSSLDNGIKQQYQNAGISHILALSGLHIATVGFIVFGILRKLRLPVFISVIISTCLITLYCIMVGMPVSALRALIMFLLSMGAMLLGRTPDLRTSAAAAAVIMLMMRPDSLCDSSFLLSFSAVMGIGLVYPSLRFIVITAIGRRRIQKLNHSKVWAVRMMMGILRTLLVSSAIQLTMLPFILWFYYQFPTYGILVNIAAVPLAGFLLIFAVAVGILGTVASYPVTAPVFETAVRLPVLAVRGILKFYDSLCDIQALAPGSLIITGRPQVSLMWIYGSVLAAAAVIGTMLEKRERINGIKRLTGRAVGNDKPATVKTARVLIFICAINTALLFINDKPQFEISALYMGQGQCFVIHGKDVPTVMYDCGSLDEKEAGRYSVIPFLKYCGISRIDTVFISHLDRDHVSGLIEILNDDKSMDVSIGRIIIPGSISQKSSENHADLKRAAERLDIPVYRMISGDRLSYDRLGFECLSPVNDGMTEGDINEGSLVLSLEYRSDDKNCLRALFTGDISSETEAKLIKGGIGSYDYLQVPHHGSRSSADPEFFKRISPYAAVISAGIDNQYGHPHSETLSILKDDDRVKTFITSRDGEVDMRAVSDRGHMRFLMVSFNTL